MIDFHTHILPNIDDGAKNVEETFMLIKEAKEAGFSSIISTSHYIENYYETDVAERKVWIDALSTKLKEQNINLKLYLGSEIFMTDKLIELLEKGRVSTINNTNYVLFELPLYSKPINLYDIVYEMLENKLVPILAHPERYSFVQQEPEILCELIKKGVLMQCNYASIIGKYGEKARVLIRKLLENNMVHFLGSDVHKPNTIYPQIPKILEDIERLTGKQKVEEITITNPRKILNNEIIEIEEPTKIKLSFKEKMIMKHK